MYVFRTKLSSRNLCLEVCAFIYLPMGDKRMPFFTHLQNESHLLFTKFDHSVTCSTSVVIASWAFFLLKHKME